MPLLKPPRGIRVNKTHPLAKGLIGCWLMNEGTGGKVYDLSGNGNHGTLEGDTHWVPGRYGPCLSFDGDRDGVDCGFVHDACVNNFTITLWEYPAIQDNDMSFAGTRTASNTGWSVQHSTWLGDKAGLQFTIQGVGGYQTSIPRFIDFGVWSHIAYVYNGTSISFFHNGLFKQTRDVGTMTPVGDLLIGAQGPISVGPFNGLIDDVMLFNRVLTSAEIASLYADPFQMFRYDCPAEYFTYTVPAAFQAAWALNLWKEH